MYLVLLMFPVVIVLLLLGVPVALAMMSTALLFGLCYFGDSVLFQFVSAVDSTASNFVLAAVPLFVFMGSMLERTGIAEQLFEALHLWTKRIPGGLAVSTVAMCAIFAASSGVIGATEVVVGLLAIPVMLEHKYDAKLISGTICAGGSLGTIIPPSIVVVILGPVADVSVADLFVSIIIPGAILSILYMLYVVVSSRLSNRQSQKEIDPLEQVDFMQRLKKTAAALFPPLVMIFAVMGSIIFGWASPTEAAGLGALGSLLLAVCYRKCSGKIVAEALKKTLTVTCMILFILLAGNMFTGVFIASGGGGIIEDSIAAADLVSWQVLAIVLILSFFAGLFLDWISIILLFIPIFMPLITAAGYNEIWFCTLFLLIIQTSYLTPPMAPAIFYLRGISPPEITLDDMFRGVVPFIALQVVTLVLVLIFPELATWLPEQLLGNH